MELARLELDARGRQRSERLTLISRIKDGVNRMVNASIADAIVQ
jgi:hypothetical protein